MIGQPPPPAQIGGALSSTTATSAHASLVNPRASSGNGAAGDGGIEGRAESLMPMTASDVELRENSIGLTLGVPRLSSVSRESSLAGASLGGPLGAAWRLGDHSGLAPAGARAVPSSLVGAAAGSGAVGSVVNRESITSLNSDAIGSVNISQLQAQFPGIFGVAGEDSLQSNSSVDMLREDSASIMYSSARC